MAPPAPHESLAALLRGTTDPDHLPGDRLIHVTAAADRVGLAPALWAQGCRSRWWHAVPDDAAALILERSDVELGQPQLALQRAFEANGARNRDLLDQGTMIEAALEAAGIDHLRLKGWHTLTAGWWPDPAERTMTDLDLLVPDAQTADASRVLHGLGYRPIVSGHTESADHELPPVHLPGRAGSVEIHRSLAVRRWADVLPADDLLAGPRPMSTSDAVTHLILHAQLHDESHLLGLVPWRALHELSVVAASPLGTEVDWELVRRRFGSQRARAAHDGFLWLARDLLGAQVPRPSRSPRLRSRAARALMDRPELRASYARVAFLPRALSSTRMRALEPDSPVWVTRAHWLGARVRRMVSARRAGT